MKKAFFAYLFLSVLPISVSAEVSGKKTSAACGEITEGEFTNSKEVHSYSIKLEPGDKVDFLSLPVGAYLRLQADLIEPTGQVIESITGARGQKMELKSKTLSGRGSYSFIVRNHSRAHDHSGRAGMYELHVGCTKRNGTEIRPSS